MAELQNLTEQNVSVLQEFFKNQILATNPDARLIIKQEKQDHILKSFDEWNDNPKIKIELIKQEIKSLRDKIVALDQKIDRIFGDHSLIAGKFISSSYPFQFKK